MKDTLKCAVGALHEREIPFVVGGSVAAWARGGPMAQNDLDLMVKPSDAERAVAALGAAGMRTERPVEEWLLKAWHGDILVDVIFHPAGLEITDEVFERADVLSVFAVATPVMAIEDVLATKLNALTEHDLDYRPTVAIARAVREQVDWQRLRAQTASSPFARAFFVLAEDLEIIPAAPGTAARSGRVRVLAATDGP